MTLLFHIRHRFVRRNTFFSFKWTICVYHNTKICIVEDFVSDVLVCKIMVMSRWMQTYLRHCSLRLSGLLVWK